MKRLLPHSSESGRRAEADRILKTLEGEDAMMTIREMSFLADMRKGLPVSESQLFWLAKLKNKYL